MSSSHRMRARGNERPRFSLTHHAVDRFVERFRPDLEREAAFQLLRAEARSATYFGRARDTGELWRIASLDAVLVVKHEHCPPGVVAVVTVVPTAKIGEAPSFDAPEHAELREEVLEAARRAGLVEVRPDLVLMMPFRCDGAMVADVVMTASLGTIDAWRFCELFNSWSKTHRATKTTTGAAVNIAKKVTDQ